MIENLLTRAADTSDTTWIERFAVIDPSEMAAVYFPDMQPKEANSLLAGMFGDDTDRILSKWSELRVKLESYDSAVEYLENFEYEKLERMIKEISAFDPDSATPEQSEEIAAKLIEVQIMQTQLADRLETVALHDYLDSVVYLEEFTMLDFFSQTLDELRADKSVLYPMAAALSAGQRAGLDFISLRELILLCAGNGEQYVNTDLSVIDTASIYEGVDRGIYEKGGVALTSEALRRGAATVAPDEYKDSTLTSLFFAITMSAAGFAAFTLVSGAFNKAMFLIDKVEYSKLLNLAELTEEQAERVASLREGMTTLSSQTKMCMQLTIGITLLAVIAGSITVYLTYRDMCEYYHTEFSPIPLYMVDESDITAINAKGETIVIKNQKAYYRAVLCNRTEADEKYAEIDDKADLNGDVGRMWVALYFVKNPALSPILADSFKVVYGSDNAPLEYTKGIHKFGSGSAFDLNNTYYAWNHGRDGIYVYYKTDNAMPRGTGAIGSITSAGALAAAGGAGLLIGLLAGLFIVRGRGRKRMGKKPRDSGKPAPEEP